MNNKLKAMLSVLISIIIVTVMLTFAIHNSTAYLLIALIVTICAISYVVYDIL